MPGQNSDQQKSTQKSGQPESNLVQAPSISLPKGGGSIHGMGEKFSANPVTGTGSMSIPIATSPGRAGFGPQLALSYDSGAGNSSFGLGWNLSLPSIIRKTDKGLPQYFDEDESDTFILAGAEDLVPLLEAAGNRLAPRACHVYGKQYLIKSYRPRVEGLFALIEKWAEQDNPSNTFWRTISHDNITTWYGRKGNSCIYDPANAAHIYQWMVCQTYDDKGNVVEYEYMSENGTGVDIDRVDERNRTNAQRRTNRYLQRIYYGNLKPYLPTLEGTPPSWQEAQNVPGQKWMFEVVFDYGQCELDAPQPDDNLPLRSRYDPFSSNRAGFEIRTYRLCHRVLMFHHFEDEAGVGNNCLVKSTNFSFKEPASLTDAEAPGYTVLQEASHHSYIRKPAPDVGYETRQLPPVKFTYSQPMVNKTIQTIAPHQLENLPVGAQGPGYQWIDLDGEGLSGVLSEQFGAWYYKPNLGAGTFGPLREVARQPAMAQSAGSRHQFMDLAGNGEIDVVDFGGPAPGFHERDQDEGWKRHVPFVSLPNIDWQDPNLRFVDLTGDGHADALITEQEVFTWYTSLAESGFAAASKTRQATDEEAGARLVFADGTQTIFLADMCGDGLIDLVRIRNGEVCYWPNLGYGHFGHKITLGNSPRFDHADMYDPRRIRLTDIDGSGPVDLIYLGRNGAQLYFNRSGNSLSNALLVDLPVATENLGAVQVADLLGNGTACLVWNSHLPADSSSPVYYIDLMGGAEETALEHARHEKPHLLIKTENNLGGSSEIEYTPSTRFYIQDKLAGTPWVTRLPFPVHCVSRVTVHDKWRGTTFSSIYSYHHGYFDGTEREFRGFGRVEQVDVESYKKFQQDNNGSPWISDAPALYQPPVKNITWYHTGAALDRQHILGQFAHEYFPQRFADRLSNPIQHPNAFRENVLSEPELPANLSGNEWREALRACKGMVLRQEVYELDANDLNAVAPKHTPVRIYSAATHNCHIQCLQQRGENRHAVFLVTESEALSYQYELTLPKDNSALTPDPRIAHTLNLRHDVYGNPQQSIAIGYPRIEHTLPQGLPSDAQRDSLIRAVQSELHIAYSETRYTNDVVLPEPVANPAKAIRHHRLRLPCEVKTYEITGLAKLPAGGYFDITDLRRHALCEDESVYPPVIPAGKLKVSLGNLQYHQLPLSATPHRRIVEHARTLFFDDASDTAPLTDNDKLPFGQHGPRGLKYEDYKLALTTSFLDAVFKQTDAAGKVDDKLAWEVQPGITARDFFNDPTAQNPHHLKSGYILGVGIDASLTGQYWMRSGIAGFENNAHDNFYLPNCYTDPFGNQTHLQYDERKLFITQTRDAKNNTAGIAIVNDKPRFDYRVLAPLEMVDANGNYSEVAFDIRGLVVAAAVKGKEVTPGQWQGDNLSGLSVGLINPPSADVVSFCTEHDFDNNKLQTARTWLGNASSRFVYHFGETAAGWGQHMPGACSIVREIHASQPGGATSPLQIALECSDASGNVLMKKMQAEPDPAMGTKRWIVNGLTILNNKGKPVKQYEPAFSNDFGCELPQATGVTPIMYYDAAGRVIRTELPDGTLSRVEFSPWHVKTFDANDTVLESAWYREKGRNRFDPAAPLPQTLPGLGVPPTPDERTGWLAAQHANTPALTLLDSQGREVIAIAHNRTPDSSGTWQDEYYLTYTKLDAEGKPLWIRDARGNLVMQYITPSKAARWAEEPNEDIPGHTDPATGSNVYSAPAYDIAGNLLFQHSMDAGDRWMLMDAAGKPMLAWDINDKGSGTPIQKRLFRSEYDELHRPIAQWLKLDDADPALIEAFDYCDTSNPGALTLDEARMRNLIGQATTHWDPSGRAKVESIDLCAKPAHITRTLIKPDAVGGADMVDWQIANRASLLDGEIFHQITEYDALGRMTTLYNWHRDAPDNRVAVYKPIYNERSLLKSETLDVRASKTSTGHTPSANGPVEAIKEIRYNAKGQKEILVLAQGKTTTTYTYDLQTYRLTSLKTKRSIGNTLQNLSYTYDPVGNITHLNDAAQDTVWFRNTEIRPEHTYTYDALYRLIEATGRENPNAPAPMPNKEGTWPQGSFPTGDIPRNYTQSYVYDAVGNFVEMNHLPSSGTGWTRYYKTAADSNRLLRTWYGDPDWNSGNAIDKIEYRYDIHGSMLNLNQTPEDWGQDIRWDWRDMICSFDAIGGGMARYHYGIDKQRTRKHITRNSSAGGTFTEDRIYLGGYELYRRRNPLGDVVEEIESLHLFEGEQRVLLVDDVITTNNPRPDGLNVRQQILFRYQYGNHLGSVGLELDHASEIISYEEFHPYGTSAYRLMNSAVEAPAKRYRYTGMERDEESGLSYHTVRYYMPWLGRWSGSDPIGIADGVNAFTYCRCNPSNKTDPTGRATEGDSQIYWESKSEGFIKEHWMEHRTFKEMASKEGWSLSEAVENYLYKHTRTSLSDKQFSQRIKTPSDAQIGKGVASGDILAKEAFVRSVAKNQAELAAAGKSAELRNKAFDLQQAQLRGRAEGVLQAQKNIDAGLQGQQQYRGVNDAIRDGEQAYFTSTSSPKVAPTSESTVIVDPAVLSKPNPVKIGPIVEEALIGGGMFVGGGLDVFAASQYAEEHDMLGTTFYAATGSAQLTGAVSYTSGWMAGSAAGGEAMAFGVAVAAPAAALSAAVGGVGLAVHETSAALEGHETAIHSGLKFFDRLRINGEKQRGLVGGLKNGLGLVGTGLFFTLDAYQQGLGFWGPYKW